MTSDNVATYRNIQPLPRLGWIGAGVMGAPMCEHLIDAGFNVILHSRTKSKAQRLLRKGARWADCPKTLTKASDIVFTMVGFPEDVREVYFADNGILAGARTGRILVDMTTSRPGLAREICQSAKARGVDALDAPVSGGDIGAREGTLAIMAGGDKRAFLKIKPYLEILGRRIVYHGKAGSGQNAKLANQIAIAGAMIGVCEALLYGYKSGLNEDALLDTLRSGAADCWTLNHLAPRILKRDFEPGFYVEHFIKDMAIALEESHRMKLALPGLAMVHQLYLTLHAQGHGRRGTQALILALEHLSNIERV